MGTTISNNLKHLRRMQNVSQQGLADASGISIRTIQRIESGESIGSAYTIDTLANALHITSSDLITNEIASLTSKKEDPLGRLKLLNLSAFSIILIPLSNLIIPFIIYFRNKDNALMAQEGRRIISFHILWTFCTLALMLILPLLLMSFQVFRASSMPIAVPVYLICVSINIYFTTRIAMSFNKPNSILENIPNVL